MVLCAMRGEIVEGNLLVITMAVISRLHCALAHSVLIGRIWKDQRRLQGPRALPAQTPSASWRTADL